MESDTFEIVYPAKSDYQDIFGSNDKNIQVIQSRYGVSILCRDGGIKVIGEKNAVRKAAKIIGEIDTLISSGTHLDEHTLSSALDYIENGGSGSEVGLNTVVLNAKGKQIKPRSLGQCLYLKAIMENEVVFSIGPAGTGKTYLAVALAVAALQARTVHKIILCRPAVEAGESLGFLPGDLQDKVEPYFRPLYDALFDTLGPEKLAKLQERGVVEIAPLAFMRGRTLANSFIILDEAQNTTALQMKMILTRLGYGSKMVITGDATQVDIPKSEQPGLSKIEDILTQIKGVSFVKLTTRDVVRHRLVQDIINAYEKHEARKDA